MATHWYESSLWMVAHMVGALLLGWVVGYERYFSGRAGSQVYCLVCTTCCAITLLCGFPSLWYGGSSNDAAADPTRVIGSILTGIGFLGAGIIVQTGMNVRGLTTAASIWGSSAIGILVGVGFYLPAVSLTVLFVVCTTVVPHVERRLPSHVAIAVTLRFRAGITPRAEDIHRFLSERGLSIPTESLSIGCEDGRFELKCLILAAAPARSDAMSKIALELQSVAEVDSFSIAHSSRV